MSSIEKPDVASNPNSGSAITQVAKGGKELPLLENERTEQEADEQIFRHIEPQDVMSEYTGISDELDPLKGSGTAHPEYDSKQLRDRSIASAVTRLNDYVQNEKRDLEFAINEEAGVSVVKVISRQSGELIRQIPGDEVVDLARKLNDQEPLRLFSAQV